MYQCCVLFLFFICLILMDESSLHQFFPCVKSLPSFWCCIITHSWQCGILYSVGLCTHTQRGCCFKMWNTWDVSDMWTGSVKAISVVTGLSPVLPPHSWIKCNITSQVLLCRLVLQVQFKNSSLWFFKEVKVFQPATKIWLFLECGDYMFKYLFCHFLIISFL